MSSSSNNLAKNAAIGKKPVNRASERDQVDPREGPSKESGSNGSSDARYVVDNRKEKDRSRSRSSDRRARRVADKTKLAILERFSCVPVGVIVLYVFVYPQIRRDVFIVDLFGQNAVLGNGSASKGKAGKPCFGTRSSRSY